MAMSKKQPRSGLRVKADKTKNEIKIRSNGTGTRGRRWLILTLRAPIIAFQRIERPVKKDDKQTSSSASQSAETTEDKQKVEIVTERLPLGTQASPDHPIAYEVAVVDHPTVDGKEAFEIKDSFPPTYISRDYLEHGHNEYSLIDPGKLTAKSRGAVPAETSTA